MKKQRIKICLVCCLGTALSACFPGVRTAELDSRVRAHPPRHKAVAAVSVAAIPPLRLEDLDLFRLDGSDQEGEAGKPIPPEIAHYLDLFSSTQRDVVLKHAELAKDITPEIQEILLEKGLPREILTLAYIESRFNPSVRSPNGQTVGMWQLEKRTAEHYGLVVNRRKDERKDPLKATAAAAQLLVDLREHFGTWALALAAYNGGKYRVEQAIRDSGGERSVFSLCARGLISQTTKNYLARFAALTLILGNPERYGFSELAATS